ncbi:hypothetical protein D1AOALGA4SA_4461 [Olavius algarvensis Delta 1 endosymbiont]|nr:hypothetical protein D1AOALGA4SA_4461 [Olavius algarvensis Delta 1 endosymbiont]
MPISDNLSHFLYSWFLFNIRVTKLAISSISKIHNPKAKIQNLKSNF